MFCPVCGLENIKPNQFCRSCGVDLRSVRTVLARSDSITASAVSARGEIGQAIAAKIQQTDSSSELSKFAEKVLPEIEKFLESPEERKLRRMRVGSTVSFVGLGVSIAFFIASQLSDPELIFFSALGFVTLFVGLAITVNGLFLTVPRKELKESQVLNDEEQNQTDGLNPTTKELLMPPTAQHEFTSVTEHTTKHLKNKKPV